MGDEVSNLAAKALNNQPSLRDVALSLTLAQGTAIHPAKRILEDLREDR